MKEFMDKDFLLETETAKRLFHDHAENMPIYDYHNHLSAQEIYEDKHYDNITQIWLGGDHYKWRAMRANGIDESLITGHGADRDKFNAWAQTVPYAFGNPLYHWTHLELQRYFDIDDTLSPKTADKIWEACNAKLAQPEYGARGLLKKMNAKALGTTDDPSDDLKYHKLLQDEGYDMTVRPTFRPDRALDLTKPDFAEYIQKLADSAGITIEDYDDLKKALVNRMDHFDAAGCRMSDHSLDDRIFEEADEAEAAEFFAAALTGEPLTQHEQCQYRGNLLRWLAEQYHDRRWGMQLHIGPLRNNSERMFELVGADTGFDSMDDFNYARQLAQLLSAADKQGKLPKTVLYCMNPKDTEMLATMTGNFQDGSIPGKVQLGTAWWMCDHQTGMERQMNALSDVGLLSRFVGMVTDSRSFLSFPRHEYFRRILCNFIGNIVEDGKYPNDEAFLGEMTENICYNNAKEYIEGRK